MATATTTATDQNVTKSAWKAPVGSWRCTSCANINYPTRNACNRCGMARAPDLLNPNQVQSGNWTWLPVPNNLSRTLVGNSTFRPPIGSWRCPDEKCKNINFPQRTQCNRCGTPQPNEEISVKTPPAEKMKPGCWVCPKVGCNNVNFPFREVCHRCNTLKPFTQDVQMPFGLPGYGGVPSLPPNMQNSPAMSQNMSLAVSAAMLGLNPFGYPALANASQKKWTPPPGSWRCPSCNNINFASRKTCNRCQQPRPDATA